MWVPQFVTNPSGTNQIPLRNKPNTYRLNFRCIARRNLYYLPNWRLALRAGAAVSDSTMESGDWKDDEQRQMIVNKIMDIFKKHLPFSAYERLQELKKNSREG
ncbi:putative mediator complex subunit 15, KIX domain-containing protein [Helianthus anomalus]